METVVLPDAAVPEDERRSRDGDVRTGSRYCTRHRRRGIANPVVTIRSGALLLDGLGYRAEADRVGSAVEAVLWNGTRVPDLGGDAGTDAVTDCERSRRSSPFPD